MKNKYSAICKIIVHIFMVSLYQVHIHAEDSVDYFSSTHGRVDRICRTEVGPAYFLKGKALPFATFKDNVLCLTGDITPDGANNSIKILKKYKINSVFIWSNGGEVNAALSLAEEINKHDIDVYAFYRCGSSCANYIFLAGKRKHVLPGTIVSWHGAPMADADSPPALKAVWERHRKFFRKIAVNDELTRLPQQCNIENNGSFQKSVDKNEHPNWTYRKSVLEGYFHVMGIVEMWEQPLDDPAQEADSSTVLADQPKIFLFHQCP